MGYIRSEVGSVVAMMKRNYGFEFVKPFFSTVTRGGLSFRKPQSFSPSTANSSLRNCSRWFCVGDDKPSSDVDSDSLSDSHILLIKLLHQPPSRIKSSLDDEKCCLRLTSSNFSWDSLLTSLRYSSSQKACLVLEWLLEKMMKENERDPGLYSQLISLCGKIQNLSLAMHVFSSMESSGIKPTSPVFNSLIGSCLSSNDFATAFSLFEIMESSEKFKSDSETYDIFISSFSSSGNIDAMFEWYSAKLTAGFNPSLQTYEFLISGCVKYREFSAADRIYDELIASGLVPSTFVLEYRLKGLCKQRSVSRVKEFLLFLFDGGWEINETMAEQVARFYVEMRDVKEMENLLESLRKSDQVGGGILSRIHCGIIKIYAMLDRLDGVEYAVGRMLKEGFSFVSADEVEKVICSYFRQSAYDKLDLFLKHIKTCCTLSRSTYDLLIAGYKRAGLLEKIDPIVKDMELAGIL